MTVDGIFAEDNPDFSYYESFAMDRLEWLTEQRWRAYQSSVTPLGANSAGA